MWDEITVSGAAKKSLLCGHFVLCSVASKESLFCAIILRIYVAEIIIDVLVQKFGDRSEKKKERSKQDLTRCQL